MNLNIRRKRIEKREYLLNTSILIALAAAAYFYGAVLGKMQGFNLFISYSLAMILFAFYIYKNIKAIRIIGIACLIIFIIYDLWILTEAWAGPIEIFPYLFCGIFWLVSSIYMLIMLKYNFRFIKLPTKHIVYNQNNYINNIKYFKKTPLGLKIEILINMIVILFFITITIKACIYILKFQTNILYASLFIAFLALLFLIMANMLKQNKYLKRITIIVTLLFIFVAYIFLLNDMKLISGGILKGMPEDSAFVSTNRLFFTICWIYISIYLIFKSNKDYRFIRLVKDTTSIKSENAEIPEKKDEA